MPARLAVLVLLALVLAAPAGAADRENRARATAERALEKVRAAQGRERTPALLELFKRRDDLGSADRRRADRYFARPTDANDPDNDGELGADYRVPEADPLCGGNFCIHYVRTTEDAPPNAAGPGHPPYVQRVLEVFEQVAARENGDAPAGLEWPLPPADVKGGGPQVDVYLADIGDKFVYGYASPDRDQPKDAARLHAYQVMDNDYAEFVEPGMTALEALQVTAAHEYNHVLQLGINATLDDWIFESTATWMEEEVYPEIDDYLQYLPSWASASGRPLTTFDPDGVHQYGSAVWNHYLAYHYGEETIRDAWTRSLPDEDSLTAYERAIPIGPDGGRFSSELSSFALGLSEWTASPSDYPDGDRYSDVERTASVTVDGPPVTLTLDHASFALVDITGQGADTIAFEATFPQGLRYGVGIYGGPGPRMAGVRGGNLGGGVSNGSPQNAQLIRPNTHARVTGVAVNSDRRHEGRDATGEFRYVADDQPVTVRAYTYRGPGGPGTTPGPTQTPSPTPTPAPAPTPVPTPTPPVIDTTGPTVVIPSANRSLRASRTGLVRFRLGPMQENTTGVVSLKSDKRVRVGGRRRVLALGSAEFQALKGQRVAARIRLRRSVRRALRRLKRVRVQATLTVRDAAGNATTRTYRFTLRAPRRR